jgi:HK97 family phage major capsid protein
MNLKPYYDAVVTAEARVQDLAGQINALFEKNQTEDALKLRPDLDLAKATAKNANDLYLSMRDAVGEGQTPAQRFVPASGTPDPQTPIKDVRATPEYFSAFFSAFRSGASPRSIKAGMHRAEQYNILLNALTETGGNPVGEEGGFLLPVEFDNKIRELMRQFKDLAMPQYFNIETVTAYSGWRAVEQAAAALPFAAIVENVTLAATESPVFSKLEYTIVDYGGYLPVTNDLLSDTPVNLMTYLAGWFAKKVVLTNNSLILAAINALTPVAVTDYKTSLQYIKTALNKTLDPDIAAGATIFTNQSGLDVLDQLDDGTGRPLLQPDVSNATEFRVKGRELVVLSDAQWPLKTGTKARVAIGDGRQLLTFFRRQAFEMAATTIGGDAWRLNNTEVRGIMRADVVTMDADAMSVLDVTVP